MVAMVALAVSVAVWASQREAPVVTRTAPQAAGVPAPSLVAAVPVAAPRAKVAPKVANAPSPQVTATAPAMVAAAPVDPVPPAAPFDRATYTTDPAAHCAVVAPGRCFQVAAPAATVAALARVGAGGFALAPGGEADLAALTEPGLPVTFTSFGLGAFTGSGLASITVAADADGVATARFRITPGTVGKCLIIAGSPVRAGTISFLVTVVGDNS